MEYYERELVDNASSHEDSPRLVDEKPEAREPDNNPFNCLLDEVTMTKPQETATALPRVTGDEIARRQLSACLAEAMQTFKMPPLDGCTVINETPVAANDNDAAFKHKEPWPLEEAIKRAGKTHLLETMVRIRNACELADADPMAEAIHRPGKAPSPDYHQQRAVSTGRVFYAPGQSLDRKKKRYDGAESKSGKTKNPKHKDGEVGAVRYDGSARIAARSDAGDLYFDPQRADMFSQRQIDARNERDDIRAAVGEGLWQPLFDACSNQLTFAQIAEKEKLKKSDYASVLVWRALDVAHKAITARRAAISYRQYVNSGFPVPGARWLRAAA